MVTPSIKKNAVIKMEGLVLMRDKVIGIKMEGLVLMRDKVIGIKIVEKVLWFMWWVGNDI